MGKRMWLATVSGPLAPYAAGFESWLRPWSYSPSAVADKRRYRQSDALRAFLEAP